MTGETIERARYRWREILARLGVETRFLTGKHGPCPLCGGKDRFRYDDKDGSGSYFCNQCGAGNGITLLRKFQGWSFLEACTAIDEVIGKEPKRAKPETNRREQSDAARLTAIQRLLRESSAPEVVETDLKRRGLSVTSRALLGNAWCAYRDDKGDLAGGYPATIAPVHDVNGQLVSAHRIYDAPVWPNKN